MAFDPYKFGFDIRPTNLGKSSVDGNYILRSNKDNDGRSDYKLVLDSDTAALAEIVTDGQRRLSIRMNGKGHFLIFDGASDKRKLSRVTKSSGTAAVSVSGFSKAIEERYGDKFRHVFFDAKPYSGGEALLLVPNGEVDF